MIKNRSRSFKKENYHSFWIKGKTYRYVYDATKPIADLKYPEFYDIKINNYCEGNCSYCYQNSGEEDEGYNNSFEKIKSIFIKMTENEKPYQIAIGGGNPNQHKDFIEIIKWLDENNICPNYTTNGIGLTEEILEASEKYCGGVAITCHPHLESIWKDAIEKFKDKKIILNLHLVISDKESIDYFIDTYKKYNKVVSYFVLLPYISNVGRADKKEIDYKYLENKLKEIEKIKQIAFGAHFYEWLKIVDLDVLLYEPEIMSKFIDLKDMMIYKSSFEKNPICSVEDYFKDE